MKLSIRVPAAIAAALLAGVAVSPAMASGQDPLCDPTIEICDPPADGPIGPGPDAPLDPPPDDPAFEEPPFDDPFFCDPYIDPACDPRFDDPFGPPPDDAFFCDPYFDPTCDPDFVPPLDDPAFADPVYAPTADGTFADDPFFCDPFIDPSCAGDPPQEIVDYCAAVSDPLCDLVIPATTAPPAALAFATPPARSASDAPITRDDVNDDISVEEIPAERVPEIAANRLLLVVDALAELGALERTPDPDLNTAVRQVRDDIPADGLTEDGYRDEVRRFVAELPVFLDQLDGAGVAVSDSLRALAAQFSAESLDELDAGGTALFDARVLFSSIADLSARGGEAPGARDPQDDMTQVLGLSVRFAEAEQVATTTTTAAPATTTAPTTTIAATTTAAPVALAAAADDEPASGGALGLWIGIGTAIALAAAALFAVLRRGNDDTQAAVGGGNTIVSVDDLLDASRRMSASLKSAEIVSIALGETRRLVDAEGGIVVMRNDGELTAAGAEPARFFRPEMLSESSLRRVVEAGRSVVTITEDEPILVEVPVAMAAVPIVVDGHVAGSLMVVRIPSRPFDRDELEALEMLAPLVGSALNAAAAHDSATELVDVEPMTGLMNRRRLDRDLAALDDDDLVSWVMVDVDHFKNFNDVNGHAAGDDALCAVADALAASVRPEDVVYRYGGEEFGILLPGATAEEAAQVAERARAAVEATDIEGGENQPSGRVTISIGVADTEDRSLEDLVERADKALYEAKHGGRNQVCIDLTD